MASDLLSGGWKKLHQLIMIFLISRGIIRDHPTEKGRRILEKERVAKGGLSYDDLLRFLTSGTGLSPGMFQNVKKMLWLRGFELSILEEAYKERGYDLSDADLRKILSWSEAEAAAGEDQKDTFLALVQSSLNFAEILAVSMADIKITTLELADEAEISTATLNKYLKGEAAPADKIRMLLAKALYLKGEVLRKFTSLGRRDHGYLSVKPQPGEEPRNTNPRNLDEMLPKPAEKSGPETSETAQETGRVFPTKPDDEPPTETVRAPEALAETSAKKTPEIQPHMPGLANEAVVPKPNQEVLPSPEEELMAATSPETPASAALPESPAAETAKINIPKANSSEPAPQSQKATESTPVSSKKTREKPVRRSKPAPFAEESLPESPVQGAKRDVREVEMPEKSGISKAELLAIHDQPVPPEAWQSVLSPLPDFPAEADFSESPKKRNPNSAISPEIAEELKGAAGALIEELQRKNSLNAISQKTGLSMEQLAGMQNGGSPTLDQFIKLIAVQKWKEPDKWNLLIALSERYAVEQ